MRPAFCTLNKRLPCSYSQNNYLSLKWQNGKKCHSFQSGGYNFHYVDNQHTTYTDAVMVRERRLQDMNCRNERSHKTVSMGQCSLGHCGSLPKVEKNTKSSKHESP